MREKATLEEEEVSEEEAAIYGATLIAYETRDPVPVGETAETKTPAVALAALEAGKDLRLVTKKIL